MDEIQIRAAIENWAAFSRQRERTKRTRCASAEGSYRPGRLRGDAEADRRSPHEALNEAQALEVEAAWRTLPHSSKWLLKWRYIEGRAPGWIMRHLGRRNDDYRIVRLTAYRNLVRALADRRALRAESGHSSLLEGCGADSTMMEVESRQQAKDPHQQPEAARQ